MTGYRILVHYHRWVDGLFYPHTHTTYPTWAAAESRLDELKKRHGTTNFKWKIEEVKQ